MEKQRRILKEIRSAMLACEELRLMLFAKLKPVAGLSLLAAAKNDLRVEMEMAHAIRRVMQDPDVMQAANVLFSYTAYKKELLAMLGSLDINQATLSQLRALSPDLQQTRAVDGRFEAFRTEALRFLRHDNHTFLHGTPLSRALGPIRKQRDGNEGWLRWTCFYGHA